MLNARGMLLLFALLASAACASVGRPAQPTLAVPPGEATPPPGSLIGTWRGVSENAKDTSFVFQPDGRAIWNLGQAFEVRYRADSAAAPKRLDLSGFTSGPLAGRTLLCIYEIEDARRLRLDCEPSKAGVEDDSIRPRDFNPAQVQVFERDGGPPEAYGGPSLATTVYLCVRRTIVRSDGSSPATAFHLYVRRTIVRRDGPSPVAALHLCVRRSTVSLRRSISGYDGLSLRTVDHRT